MKADVAVVGSGITGLATACLVARSGRRVIVFERSAEPGGRARTMMKDGFAFNLGPHALYRDSEQMLRELGVDVQGGEPGATGAFALHSGRLHTFPAGLVSMLTTGLLRTSEKIEAGRLLGRISGAGNLPSQGQTLAGWLDERVRGQGVRQLLETFARVSTFCANPAILSAGAALSQVRKAFRGVRYLNGGWQGIVNGLRSTLSQSGGELLTAVPVRSIYRDSRVRGVLLEDGSEVAAPAVVIAGSPQMAMELTWHGHPTVISEWAKRAVPAPVACLDVALSRLPNPRRLVVIGIDEPVYLSVHSAAAQLAPQGGALIHAAWYGDASGHSSSEIEQRLSRVIDALQPKWRQYVVHRRFLPRLIASNAVVTASSGGLAGRPGPEVPDIPGLYVAGDWVGKEGMLTDACLASARAVTKSIAGSERVSNTEEALSRQ